jgi:hypothetical protein
MTQRNAKIAGVGGRIVVTRADARAPAARCPALFADPARRSEAGRRVHRGSDYSPALDEARLPPSVDEVEYVSWRGQCREAVLWFGGAARVRRRATVIDGGALFWDETSPPRVEVGPPSAFLYDPDPAVVRSHLVGLLAHRLDATLVTEQVAYLTSATEKTTPFAGVSGCWHRFPSACGVCGSSSTARVGVRRKSCAAGFRWIHPTWRAT